MKTIIFDLDGTLVDLGPLQKSKSGLPIKYATETMLKKLSGQYRLGIITGSSKRELIYVFESLNWDKFFDRRLIITKADKKSGKAFKAMKKKIKENIVFIGDSVSDQIGTSAAGLSCVLVKKGKNMLEQRRNLALAVNKSKKMLSARA